MQCAATATSCHYVYMFTTVTTATQSMRHESSIVTAPGFALLCVMDETSSAYLLLSEVQM